MADEENEVSGVLMRGEDGETYFIPRGTLKRYKMPEEKAKAMRRRVYQGTEESLKGKFKFTEAKVHSIVQLDGPASIAEEISVINGPPPPE